MWMLKYGWGIDVPNHVPVISMSSGGEDCLHIELRLQRVRQDDGE